MTSRNFGIATRDRMMRGHTLSDRAHAPNTTRRNSIPPLPAQSLRPDPLAAATHERAAFSFVAFFLSLVFAIPIICIFVIQYFR